MPDVDSILAPFGLLVAALAVFCAPLAGLVAWAIVDFQPHRALKRFVPTAAAGVLVAVSPLSFRGVFLDSILIACAYVSLCALFYVPWSYDGTSVPTKLVRRAITGLGCLAMLAVSGVMLVGIIGVMIAISGTSAREIPAPWPYVCSLQKTDGGAVGGSELDIVVKKSWIPIIEWEVSRQTLDYKQYVLDSVKVDTTGFTQNQLRIEVKERNSDSAKTLVFPLK